MSTTTPQNAISLFDVGALVNLKIHSWSGRKMITRKDLVNVGYDPDALPVEICNLGRKLLVPKPEIQAMNRVEQRARKILDRYAVPFGISNSHFVPIKMLPTIQQQIDELREEFFTLVDSFIVRFDDLIKAIRESHPEFWEKCLQGNYPSDPKSLRRYYKFEFFTFRIAGMDSIQETNVNEIVANQKIVDERTRELRIQMQEEVKDFVGEYVESMREETIRFCNLMKARVNGDVFEDEEDIKKLTPKSISCFRKHLNRFRDMNIFGDDEIEKLLDDLNKTFLNHGVSPKDFESPTVVSSITSALEKIREKAAAESDSSSKFIGELKRRIVL